MLDTNMEVDLSNVFTTNFLHKRSGHSQEMQHDSLQVDQM